MSGGRLCHSVLFIEISQVQTILRPTQIYQLSWACFLRGCVYEELYECMNNRVLQKVGIPGSISLSLFLFPRKDHLNCLMLFSDDLSAWPRYSIPWPWADVQRLMPPNSPKLLSRFDCQIWAVTYIIILLLPLHVRGHVMSTFTCNFYITKRSLLLPLPSAFLLFHICLNSFLRADKSWFLRKPIPKKEAIGPWMCCHQKLVLLWSSLSGLSSASDSDSMALTHH